MNGKNVVIGFIVVLLVAMAVTFFGMNVNSKDEIQSVVASNSNEETKRFNLNFIEQIFRELTDSRDTQSLKKTEDEENGNNDSAPTIYVDPGHGGDANGGTTVGGTFKDGSGLTEETNNFKIALAVKKALTDAGYNVKLSREQAGIHNAISNKERGKAIASCDAGVCIHSNGTSDRSAYGCFNVVDKRYPYNKVMGDAFLAAMKANGRNTCYAGYFNKDALDVFHSCVSNGGSSEKILYIEVGAHDNPNDMAYISSTEGHKQIAECILKAIQAYVPVKKESTGGSNENNGNNGNNNGSPKSAGSQVAVDWNTYAAPKAGRTWDQLSDAERDAATVHWNHMVAEGKPGYTGW